MSILLYVILSDRLTLLFLSPMVLPFPTYLCFNIYGCCRCKKRRIKLNKTFLIKQSPRFRVSVILTMSILGVLYKLMRVDLWGGVALANRYTLSRHFTWHPIRDIPVRLLLLRYCVFIYLTLVTQVPSKPHDILSFCYCLYSLYILFIVYNSIVCTYIHQIPCSIITPLSYYRILYYPRTLL